jgi:hypothetical protein
LTPDRQRLDLIEYNTAVANWQRGDPKKHSPPKPPSWPKETSANEPQTREEQRRRKQRFLEQRKAVP